MHCDWRYGFMAGYECVFYTQDEWLLGYVVR
jgi:hypothetical protein